MDERKRTREDAPWQLEVLTCNLMVLADNLEAGLAQGTIGPEVLPQVIAELRDELLRITSNPAATAKRASVQWMGPTPTNMMVCATM